MSDISPQSSAQLHGPGGLLSTPGLGARRTWRKRLKATQIAGNLYRGNDGKFQAGGGDSSKPAKSRATPTTQRNTLPAVRPPPKPKGGKGKTPAKAKPADTAAQARQAQRDQERAEDRAQRQADRQSRIKRQQEADFRRAADRMRREADRQAKLADPKKGGGGGGKAKPSDDEKKAEQGRKQAEKKAENRNAVKAQMRDSDTGLAPAGFDAFTVFADGQSIDPAKTKQLTDMGLIEGDPARLSSAGRAASAAIDRGDYRDAVDAIGRGQQRVSDADVRSADQTRRTQEREAATAARQAERSARQQRQLDILKRRAQFGGKLSQAQRDRLTEAGLAEDDGMMWRLKAERYGGKTRSALADSVFAGPDRSFPIVTAQDVRDAVRSLGRTNHDKEAVKRGIIRRARAIGAVDALPEDWRAKSFAVFKDASGEYRWLSRSTTAYKDRDDEIIAEATLDSDSQRMTATKQFGPLRWWHVGDPDPLSAERPWGPGLDLGDCDYSVVIGRTRVESGTFKSADIARRIAAIADRLEMSPGFFHPIDQPGADGVFTDIRTFERSLVPMRYGRASNLFTGFTVKEHRMDANVQAQRFKAMVAELQLSPEQAAQLSQDLAQTEKSAAAQGITFKSADAAPEDITINGVTYTVKAPMPPAEMIEAGDTEAEDGAEDEILEDEPPVDEPAGEYMSDEQLIAAIVGGVMEQIRAELAPVLKVQEMVKALTDGVGELKAMPSMVAQKDDARAAELTALKSQYADLAAKIARIEGDQPAVINTTEVLAALKSSGPQQPAEADPTKPVVPNDPSRPMAAATAAVLPELYYDGANGWQSRPAN